MNRKFKNITPLLFLLAFLLPSIVKLEHRHDNFECKSINEKHIHVPHNRCIICNFEFSIFISDNQNIDLQNENPSDSYINNYDSQDYSYISQFSLSLRAPPLKQI